MTDPTPRAVQDYLAQLDSALTGVPADVRAEIAGGIREELAGLDEPAATTRIAELGDPAFIAAEARTASVDPSAQPEPATAPAPGRTFSIIAVIVLIAGSFFVPALGALVGLVWVSTAKAWSRREKLVAWLAPIGVALAGFGVAALVSAASGSAPGQLNNLSGWHLAVLLAYGVFPIEGIVLAVRAHRRGWRPNA